MDSEDQEQNFNLLLLLYLRRRRLRKKQEGLRRRRRARRWWVCPTISRRLDFGAWDHLVQELIHEEPDKFANYHRTTHEQFQWLLAQVEPFIERLSVVRDPIPAGLKLSLTLRYLASGDSMVSLSYQCRVGKSSTSLIIAETCEAIWDVLQPRVLPSPSRERWQEIAADFFNMWNFPNCVGSIDGKHVVVQSFHNTGSSFYNYKGTFSTVLMACCDARYRFVMVSIGSAGRESDGGIFQSVDFGQSIIRERLLLPENKIFCGFHSPLPAVFVGDAAFRLLKNLMRPFGGANVPPAETIFNYRLSRARRVVENAFGVLEARFKIFRRPICARAATVDKIVQAACVLQNWLRTWDLEGNENQHRYIPPDFVDREDASELREGQWRLEGHPRGLIAIPGNAARNPAVAEKETRDKFRDFFMTAGQIPW